MDISMISCHIPPWHTVQGLYILQFYLLNEVLCLVLIYHSGILVSRFCSFPLNLYFLLLWRTFLHTSLGLAFELQLRCFLIYSHRIFFLPVLLHDPSYLVSLFPSVWCSSWLSGILNFGALLLSLLIGSVVQ